MSSRHAKKSPTRAYLNMLSESGVALLIIFTPLAFGSVHIWASAIMEMLAFSTVAIWCIRNLIYPEFRTEKTLIPMYIAFTVLCIAAIIQLIPFTSESIYALSPRAYELFEKVIPGFGAAGIRTVSLHTLSITPHATQSALLKFLAPASIFLLIAHDFKRPERILRIAAILLFTASIEALYGLYGYFSNTRTMLGFQKLYYFKTATGTFVNRNHFAGYLVMVLLFSCGYILATLPRGEHDSFKKAMQSARGPILWSMLLGILSMLLGILFSLSRMGTGSLILSLFLMVVLVSIQRRKLQWKALLSIAAAGSGILLLYDLRALMGRFSQAYEQLQAGRLIIWGKTLEIIRDFPLTGGGLGSFSSLSPLYAPEGVAKRYLYAHNDYLELASDMGVPVAVTVITLSLFSFLLLLLKRRQATSPISQWISLGSVGALMSIFLFSISDFNLQIPANAMTLAIIAGLGWASLNIDNEQKDKHRSRTQGEEDQKEEKKRKHHRKRKPRREVLKRIPAIIALLLLGIAMAQSAALLRAERVFSIEQRFTRPNYYPTITSEGTKRRALRALALTPQNPEYYVLLGNYFLNQAAQKSSIEERTPLFSEAQSYYEKALSYNPTRMDILNLLARVQMAQGKIRSATSLMGIAIEAAPEAYAPHLNFAMTVMDYFQVIPMNQKTLYAYRAQKEFEEALAINPFFKSLPQVLINQSIIHLHLNQQAQAITVLEQLIGEFKERKDNEQAVLSYSLTLADLYFAEKQYEKAYPLYQKLIEHETIENEALQRIITHLEGVDLNNSEMRKFGLQLARTHERAGDDRTALNVYQKLLQLEPSNYRMLMRAADILLRQKQYDMAYEYYRKVLQLQKSNEVAQQRIIELMRKDPTLPGRHFE